MRWCLFLLGLCSVYVITFATLTETVDELWDNYSRARGAHTVPLYIHSIVGPKAAKNLGSTRQGIAMNMTHTYAFVYNTYLKYNVGFEVRQVTFINRSYEGLCGKPLFNALRDHRNNYFPKNYAGAHTSHYWSGSGGGKKGCNKLGVAYTSSMHEYSNSLAFTKQFDGFAGMIAAAIICHEFGHEFGLRHTKVSEAFNSFMGGAIAPASYMSMAYIDVPVERRADLRKYMEDTKDLFSKPLPVNLSANKRCELLYRPYPQLLGKCFNDSADDDGTLVGIISNLKGDVRIFFWSVCIAVCVTQVAVISLVVLKHTMLSSDDTVV